MTQATRARAVLDVGVQLADSCRLTILPACIHPPAAALGLRKYCAHPFTEEGPAEVRNTLSFMEILREPPRQPGRAPAPVRQSPLPQRQPRESDKLSRPLCGFSEQPLITSIPGCDIRSRNPCDDSPSGRPSGPAIFCGFSHNPRPSPTVEVRRDILVIAELFARVRQRHGCCHRGLRLIGTASCRRAQGLGTRRSAVN